MTGIWPVGARKPINIVVFQRRLASPLSDLQKQALINVQSLIVSSAWRLYLFSVAERVFHLAEFFVDSQEVDVHENRNHASHNRLDLFVFTFLIYSAPIKCRLCRLSRLIDGNTCSPLNSICFTCIPITKLWESGCSFGCYKVAEHDNEHVDADVNLLCFCAFQLRLQARRCFRSIRFDRFSSPGRLIQSITHICAPSPRKPPTFRRNLPDTAVECFAAWCKLVAGTKTHVNSNYWSPRVKLRGAWKQKPF